MTQNFSERLRRFRQARKLTQQELADAIGVSNKTVSRWETDGGYPDVDLLVPLARSLGVTVDDLLDGDRPVRQIGRADWQNLLSFAFALGGGVLFFLLDLFMPTVVCYLAYLGCMAYGVYLQRYYTYHSRWFLKANLVMDASVNLTLCVRAVTLAAGWLAFVEINRGAGLDKAVFYQNLQANLLYAVEAALLPAAALTAATQYAVARGGLGDFVKSEHEDEKLRFCRERPGWRQTAAAAIPLLACGYWFFSYATPPLLPKIETAKPWFALLLLVLAVIFTLPLLKKGFRRWILPQWILTTLCWGMTQLLRYAYWLPRTQRYYADWGGEASNTSVSIIGRASVWTVLYALCLAAVWTALGRLRFRWEKATKEKDEGQRAD